MALRFPEARIFSIENSNEFYEETLSLLSNFAFGDRIKLSLRPLEWRRAGIGVTFTYRRDVFPEDIDVVIIDGPPGWAYRGRESCLYDVFSRVKIGGIIVLDDYSRPGERKAVSNWLCVYRGLLELSELKVNHGLAVLTKIDSGFPRWLSAKLIKTSLRSWVQFFRHWCRTILSSR